MPRSTLAIALLSLVATFAFFFEYIPPFRQSHIPYDMAVYHYSLADYAFQSLKAGRFPQWDPSMYAGMSFPANIQAALFYPPTWLMFAAAWGRDMLGYQALQDLLLAHAWVAFLLTFLWLRGKRLDPMACALGAAVYAYSGYLCTELQHFGLVAGYAWFPLALWGIDQAAERRSWWPLWKVALASALCFLAGYPPTWVAFALVVGIYAITGPWRWGVAAGAGVALAFSMLLCAAQVLPVWEATSFRVPELRYGGGLKDPWFYISYFLPNFYNFGPDLPPETNPLRDYLYLGGPGIVGIALLLRRPLAGRITPIVQGIAVCVASLVMVINPWDTVWQVLQHSALLSDVVRSYYFLAGVGVAAALLAGLGVNTFLRYKRPPEARLTPGKWVRPAIVAMGAWAIVEWIRWPAGFAHGWATAIDAAIMAAVFAFGLFVYRAQHGDLRIWLGAALLLSAGIDYKVFGTTKRFNSSLGSGPHYYAHYYPGLNTDAYLTMRANPRYRVMSGEYGPLALEMRHVGLNTPQGFDPFLSAQFRKVIEKHGTWRGDREFFIDPRDTEALRLFGIRYYITTQNGPDYRTLLDHPRFRRMDDGKDYFNTFEYLDAQMPFEAPGEATVMAWEPEKRTVTVRSPEGGTFALFDQYWPGWSAAVDGREVKIERWGDAFQSVAVPAGEHTVEFRYRERYLPLGAGISFVALAGLGVWVWRDRCSFRG